VKRRNALLVSVRSQLHTAPRAAPHAASPGSDAASDELAAVSFAASSFAPPSGLAVVGAGRMDVQMSFRSNANYLENEKNGNQGSYGWQKKKNRKSGDTANLRGYTVGSRAPPMAVSSGTTIAATGLQYKGVARRSIYTIPGANEDGELDLRSFNKKSSLFFHKTNMLAGEAGKDCFINRGKNGPLAATNEIFVHAGDSLTWSGKKDCFVNGGGAASLF
jgi:hypothetical protein